MNIVDRLIKFHQEEGVPYSFISEKIGMNHNTMRAIVGGRMKIKQEQEEKLDKYLAMRGY